jgi:hypothetical protein
LQLEREKHQYPLFQLSKQYFNFVTLASGFRKSTKLRQDFASICNQANQLIINYFLRKYGKEEAKMSVLSELRNVPTVLPLFPDLAHRDVTRRAHFLD